MKKGRSKPSQAVPGKPQADVQGLLFGVVFTLISAALLAGILWPKLRGLAYYRWAKVPCLIEHAEISGNPSANPEFRPDLRFRYQWNGIEHQGTRLWFSKDGDFSYEEISSTLEELRVRAGTLALTRAKVECRVNAADPSQAALLSDPINSGSVIAQGILVGFFVAIGVSLILSSWRSAPDPQAIQWLTAGFFTTAGLGLLFGLVFSTLLQSFAARKWEACPAQVIWSQIRTEGSGRKTRRVVDVFYRYEFGGREYRSNRYGLAGGPWNKEHAITTHSPGTTFVCMVNPRMPWLALVERTLGLKFWLLGLFALPFVAVGGFMFRWLWRDRQRKRERLTSADPGPRRSRKARPGWR